MALVETTQYICTPHLNRTNERFTFPGAEKPILPRYFWRPGRWWRAQLEPRVARLARLLFLRVKAQPRDESSRTAAPHCDPHCHPCTVPGTRPNISESHSETSTRVPFCIAKCPQFFAPMARACFPRQHAGGPPQYRVLTSTSANKAHAVRVSQSASFPAASGEWLQHASFDSELAFVKAFGRVHEQHYQKDYPVRKPSSHANLARASVTVRSELASRCTVIPNSEIA